MKQVIEVEGLTIIGEAEDLDKLRQVITRGSVQFFESADNATGYDVCLVDHWTHMGHYAFRIWRAIEKQIGRVEK